MPKPVVKGGTKQSSCQAFGAGCGDENCRQAWLRRSKDHCCAVDIQTCRSSEPSAHVWNWAQCLAHFQYQDLGHSRVMADAYTLPASLAEVPLISALVLLSRRGGRPGIQAGPTHGGQQHGEPPDLSFSSIKLLHSPHSQTDSSY